MGNLTPYFDSNGLPLYEGDKIKIGQLKGFYIVEWDREFQIWRLRQEYSNSGYAFQNVRYRIIKEIEGMNVTNFPEKRDTITNEKQGEKEIEGKL